MNEESENMSSAMKVDQLMLHIGQEIGVSDWVQIDQDRINAFADCTGDHQWIHVNAELAKKGPFGATLAQGYLLLSLLATMNSNMKTEVLAGHRMVINYGLNKVRFPSPVKVGSRIRNHAVLRQVEEKGEGRVLITVENTLEIEGEAKPGFVAETLYMLFT